MSRWVLGTETTRWPLALAVVVVAALVLTAGLCLAGHDGGHGHRTAGGPCLTLLAFGVLPALLQPSALARLPLLAAGVLPAALRDRLEPPPKSFGA